MFVSVCKFLTSSTYQTPIEIDIVVNSKWPPQQNGGLQFVHKPLIWYQINDLMKKGGQREHSDKTLRFPLSDEFFKGIAC